MRKLLYISIIITKFQLNCKAVVYPVKIGTNYQSLYNLCPGDTLRFMGDSLNGNTYGSVQGYVYNNQTHIYDNFNIVSFTNIATTYDHILTIGDSCYYYNLPAPSIMFPWQLHFNCLTTDLTEYHSSVFNINIYPNPANEIINIQFSNATKKRKVELYDAIGNPLLLKEACSNNLSITTENLTNGVYFYHILIGDKNIKTDKIVILK
ncbi:MAG: T9SS type A sorting domain-containing protein [Bacteroidia bacterium]|nr:T9SS type A sorting domain-containing protein [Bacteroidia bacterium]